jgi:hypothetical protein
MSIYIYVNVESWCHHCFCVGYSTKDILSLKWAFNKYSGSKTQISSVSVLSINTWKSIYCYVF